LTLAGFSGLNAGVGLKNVIDAARRSLGGCFAAGTPLLTPEGWKAIEDFRSGEQLLSRLETDPNAPNEVKTVDSVFVRTHLVRIRSANSRSQAW